MGKRIDNELTNKTIGDCAMKVNSRLDKGFQAYLTAYPIDKGLLINFGSTSLEVKRLFRKH